MNTIFVGRVGRSAYTEIKQTIFLSEVMMYGKLFINHQRYFAPYRNQKT